MTKHDPDRDPETEKTILDYLRTLVDLTTRTCQGHLDGVYRSSYQLLLEQGRVFIPAPRPPGIGKMPDRLCYENATATAHAHRHRGLVYAEGFATPKIASGLPLEHAWCVTPDGTVVDPTWPCEGIAYFGVAFADPTMWPTGGGGVLSDFDRCLPLLRDGIPATAVTDIGRRPTDHR